LSFTSINLPRLAIQSHGNIRTFYAQLDDMLQLVRDQLLDRFEVQARKRVRNFPYLMGEGIWLDSEKLSPDDEVREVIKHGSLTFGFIGLAETLKSLIGKHHGESTEAQKLGLEIVKHMRDYADRCAKETGLNFTLIGTPAEGLSGRFVRMDRKRFGLIPEITDREYYTNSFHVPVYFPISAFRKVELEAPYHALTNGGHITYVELNGKMADNPEAFEKIVRHMAACGIGYGSVNHPLDRDPVCGYRGIIDDVCPNCGRREDDGGPNFERIRRITGYLVGTLDRFNNAKAAEVRDRVKHL
jgi:ribonucleoside-triphosphate reductase